MHACAHVKLALEPLTKARCMRGMQVLGELITYGHKLNTSVQFEVLAHARLRALCPATAATRTWNIDRWHPPDQRVATLHSTMSAAKHNYIKC